MRKLENIPGIAQTISCKDGIFETLSNIKSQEYFKLAYDYFHDYPPHALYGHEARALLYSIILLTKPKKILEIGTFHAGTSEIICRALHTCGGGKLVTLDPYKKEYVESAISTWPEELQPLVSFFPVTSAVYFQDFSENNFDVVIIDGNHELENALYDLISSSKHISENGLIIVDDMTQPSVYQAVNIFLEYFPEWKCLDEIDGVFSFADLTEGKTLIHNQTVLFAPESICITNIPYKQTDRIEGTTLCGYALSFKRTPASGRLQALIFFSSVYFDQNEGQPSTHRIFKTVDIHGSASNCTIEFDQIRAELPPEKSYRVCELNLYWTPDEADGILELAERPKPIFV
jgi:predicted O-methyltransferase YrrM